MLPIGIGALFTIWMAVEAIRRGQANSWLWIILFFGPIGATVYFFSEYLQVRFVGFGGFGGSARKASAQDERRALADVKRLDSATAWIAYAGILRTRKQFTQAVEAGRNAVEKEAASLDARWELGLSLLGGGQPADAIEQLRAIVDKDPGYQSGDAMQFLAQAQEGARDFAGARATLEKLTVSSGRPEILFQLARIQGLMGDRDAARRSLQRIVDEAEFVPDYMQRDIKPWVKKAKKAIAQLGV